MTASVGSFDRLKNVELRGGERRTDRLTRNGGRQMMNGMSLALKTRIHQAERANVIIFLSAARIRIGDDHQWCFVSQFKPIAKLGRDPRDARQRFLEFL
jgi:hypothetical protein